jgi:hypothetical protein
MAPDHWSFGTSSCVSDVHPDAPFCLPAEPGGEDVLCARSGRDLSASCRADVSLGCDVVGADMPEVGITAVVPEAEGATGRDHEMVARVHCDLLDVRAAGIPGREIQEFNERRRGDDAPPSTAIRAHALGVEGARCDMDQRRHTPSRSGHLREAVRLTSGRRTATATRRGSGLWFANPERQFVTLWPPARRPLCDLGGGGRCVELGVQLRGPGVEDRVDRRPREGGASDA